MTDRPQPIAELHNGHETITLYDDGEGVRYGEGDVYCSEHGNITHNHIAADQCDHGAPDEPNDLPGFDVEGIVGFVLESGKIREEASKDERVIEEVLQRQG